MQGKDARFATARTANRPWTSAYHVIRIPTHPQPCTQLHYLAFVHSLRHNHYLNDELNPNLALIGCRSVPGKVVEIRRRPDRGSRSVTVNTTLNPSGTIGTAVSGVSTACIVNFQCLHLTSSLICSRQLKMRR